MEDDLKKIKMEDDLKKKWKTNSKKNGRRPQKKMEDNVKKMKKWKTTTSTSKKINLNWL